MMARTLFLSVLLLTPLITQAEITEIPLPDGTGAITAIQSLPGVSAEAPERIALATQTGGIYLGGVAEPIEWQAFSMTGLDRPVGLYPGDAEGELYVLQRPELSLLKDYDGDGKADLYRMVNRSWPLVGSVKSGAVALAVDPAGRWLVALSSGPATVAPLSREVSLDEIPETETEIKPSMPTFPIRPELNWATTTPLSPVEGYIVELGTSGELTAVVRDVGGVQAMEVQNGGTLAVVSDFGPGNSPSLHFLQLPSRPPVEEGEDLPPPLEPIALPAPSLIIPNELGANGPMGNPITVGDQWLIGGVEKGLLRVMPDSVGEGAERTVQGAVTDFLRDSESLQNVTRLSPGPDGSFFLAGTAEGKLFRVPADAEAGLTVTGVHFGTDGFEVSFSHELTRKTAIEPIRYTVTRIDQGTPEPRAVTDAIVEPDGRRVTLKLPVTLMPEGSVFKIEFNGLSRVSDEASLAHGPLFYTLNRKNAATEKPAWVEE